MVLIGNNIQVLLAKLRQGRNFFAQPDQFPVKVQQNPALADIPQ